MESPHFIFDRAQKAAERAAQKNIVARHTHTQTPCSRGSRVRGASTAPKTNIAA
jgi:hypothetical protein